MKSRQYNENFCEVKVGKDRWAVKLFDYWAHFSRWQQIMQEVFWIFHFSEHFCVIISLRKSKLSKPDLSNVLL